MIIQDNIKYTHKSGRISEGFMLECQCDQCSKTFFISKPSLEKQQEKTKTKNTYCFSCRCSQVAKDKPQCQKNNTAYWTEERKAKHSANIINSPRYQEGKKIISAKISGENNGMFGKHHTEETRKLMSKSRTGKIGENATAWKGGKFSLVRTLKRHIHAVIGWYYKVYQRDGFKCAICGSTDKIEAHHIKPFSFIVKELLEKLKLKNKTIQEQYTCLINEKEILDESLTNGITLCRKCHRHIHKNWGSHFCKVMTVDELKADYEKNKW